MPGAGGLAGGPGRGPTVSHVAEYSFMVRKALGLAGRGAGRAAGGQQRRRSAGVTVLSPTSLAVSQCLDVGARPGGPLGVLGHDERQVPLSLRRGARLSSGLAK